VRLSLPDLLAERLRQTKRARIFPGRANTATMNFFFAFLPLDFPASRASMRPGNRTGGDRVMSGMGPAIHPFYAANCA
jgi:hypothetical protein